MKKVKAFTVSTPLTIIALVVLICVGAYLAYAISVANKINNSNNITTTESTNKTNDVDVIEQSGTSTVSEQANPTDATANWKTYTNSEYGFSFEYPASYGTIKTEKDQGETGDSFGISFPSSNLIGGMASNDFSVPRGIPLWIFASDYFKYTSGKCNYGTKDYPDQIVTVDCIRGENTTGVATYFARTTSGEGGEPVIAVFIPLVNNKNYKVLTFENISTDFNSEKQLKQILSTFEFAK